MLPGCFVVIHYPFLCPFDLSRQLLWNVQFPFVARGSFCFGGARTLDTLDPAVAVAIHDRDLVALHNHREA